MSADKKIVKLDIEVRTADKAKRDWETLDEASGLHELSIHGRVEHRSFGQVADSFVPTEAQKRLVDFWKKHHLNGMCAGTKTQTEALENCESNDYGDQCKYLASVGLLVNRGYRYGTDWLWRPFPEEELLDILDAVDDEEARRLEGRNAIDFTDEDEIARLEDVIEDMFGFSADPYPLIALMMHLNLNEDDLADVERISDHSFCVHDDYYYSGTVNDLADIAEDRIDRDMWVDAVDNNWTDDSFEEWRAQWIEEDLASALGSADGNLDEHDVDGTAYLVCAY